MPHISLSFLFFFNDPATTEIYTLSLHDALPISALPGLLMSTAPTWQAPTSGQPPLASHVNQRSEEHTSELQSRRDLVCRLLLEKKKKKTNRTTTQPHMNNMNNRTEANIQPKQT